MNTFGVNTSTVEIAARLTKAPKRARDTRAAEPIAKPWKKKQKSTIRQNRLLMSPKRKRELALMQLLSVTKEKLMLEF